MMAHPDDETVWMRAFLGWTREQPALRGLALAATVELVSGGRVINAETRQLVNEALVRTGEPARLLGRLGRSLAKPIKEAAWPRRPNASTTSTR